MIKDWTLSKKICKPLLMCSAIALLAGCSTNAATGRTQFAGLMSPQQETQVGASEHEKIVKQFGLYKNSKLQSYVTEIGKRVSVNTERADVQYKFFVLDSPIVNAFALPGGYVYISRGLMALSNSEAELAGVLAHEIGHVTARHSAERYSHGVVTSLGAAVIAAAVDSTGVSQALGLGSNLYMSSYSRSQENEADSLGIRYLSKGGYEPKAMSSFLNAMQNQSAVDSKAKGEKSGGANYFSTHPATADRVAKTRNESAQLVESMLDHMSDALVDGQQVKISSFGTFSVRQKTARVGRNPKTGDSVELTGKYVPHFKPGKELREQGNDSLKKGF